MHTHVRLLCAVHYVVFFFLKRWEMSTRPLSLVSLILVLTAVGGSVWAAQGSGQAIPEASVAILAPVGIAAVVAAERRRRKLADLHSGVGIAYYTIKRLADLTLAVILLTISFPLFLLLAVAVRLDSRGPILFKRRVVGKHGGNFNMYKFRSMVEGAEDILWNNERLREEYRIAAKLKSDPRITRLGRFLRKTSLDELPQLLNVVLGNMTFVGPRPIANDEIELYGPDFERFKTVTPGITGLWQTCGRSETSYEKRVQMDMLYIDQRSILLDVWIMLSTIPAVLLKRGAM